MFLIRLFLLLLCQSVCLSSDYVELIDDLVWSTSDELDANATEDIDSIDLLTSTTDIVNLLENVTKNVTLDEVIAAETKVQELSAVLKSTIHNIRQQYKKLDIVFLIDSSSSVGKSNFRSELRFVIKFLSDFNVSFNYTRVSIVTFSSQEKIVCSCFYPNSKLFIFNVFNWKRYVMLIISRKQVQKMINANCSISKCQQLNFLAAVHIQLMH